jgi:GMP synthase-like glutamine amidotransferase
VLVIQHEESVPGGLFDAWLERRGADRDAYRIDIDSREVNPADYGMIVSLGSEFAAFDDSIPWLEKEMRLLLHATRTGLPVLGICFGGQLLARVLGGTAFRSENAEIGWLPIRSQDRSLIADGPWFQWHYDAFTAPPGARQVAENVAGPQAYTFGRSLGVQFHPEVTPEIVGEWVKSSRPELARRGVDPDLLLEETHARAETSRALAYRLFDAFLERVVPVQ